MTGSIGMLLRGTLAVGFAGALALASASIVLADNGPHVQGGTGGTGAAAIADADGCAGCHRAHTGGAQSLLVAGGDTNLCLACHGSAAQGATTNVVDGTLAGTTNGIMGGGFSFARMDSSWTASATSPAPARAVTSMHSYGGATGTLWGAGAPGTGSGQAQFALNCVSCHNPHGNGQYRILRPLPMNGPSSAPVLVPDPVAKVYTVTSPLNRYFGQVYMGGVYADQLAMDQWCASCHTRYDAPGANSATTASGDPIFTYRHSTRRVLANANTCDSCHDPVTGVANNPLGVGTGTAHVPLCQSCHVSHGSPAMMGDVSSTVAYPGGQAPTGADSHSALLRVDNRGVCRACHGR